MRRRDWVLLAAAIVTSCVIGWRVAHAGPGMMGVGSMMQAGGAPGVVPGGGFAILTEAGNNLAAENNDILILESAP